MCGIVGLFLKTPALEPDLGAMLTEMLITMTDRGPDSAGIAIYSASSDGLHKITVQSDDPEADFADLDGTLSAAIGQPVRVRVKSTHAVLDVPQGRHDAARSALARLRPGIKVMSAGDSVEIFKEVGLPPATCGRTPAMIPPKEKSSPRAPIAIAHTASRPLSAAATAATPKIRPKVASRLTRAGA